MRTEPPGRAIFLVGPSSAGKSSLGRVLIDVLPDPFMLFEADRCGLRGPSGRPELVTVAREEVVTRGVAYAIRGYLDAGRDLVVEVGLWRPSARAMAAAVFDPMTRGSSVCAGSLRSPSVERVSEATEGLRERRIPTRLPPVRGPFPTTSWSMSLDVPRRWRRERSLTGWPPDGFPGRYA